MTDQYRYPKLRWPLNLDLQAIDGEEVLIIGDPLGLTPQPLILKSAIAPVISTFDGNSSWESIIAKFKPYGLTEKLLNELVALLDRYFFLETVSFANEKRKQAEEFKIGAVRKAAILKQHCETSSNGSLTVKERFVKELDSYLNHTADHHPLPDHHNMPGDICTLISPHIDYRRGGLSYGLTYKHLANYDHTLYIVMGTAHQYSPRLFHLTRKHFETPLGIINNDTDFVDHLAKLFGHGRGYEDEFLHKQEHSLELQLPFLARVKEVRQHEPGYKIVPILVGSFHQMLAKEREPTDIEEYQTFIGALTEAFTRAVSSGARICIIAGVDMAHIGRAFGDSGSLTTERLEEIARQDRAYLGCITSRDKGALFRHMASDQNARRVCGFPTLYTVLDLLERLDIKYSSIEFDYSQSVDLDKDCAVTYAGLGLFS